MIAQIIKCPDFGERVPTCRVTIDVFGRSLECDLTRDGIANAVREGGVTAYLTQAEDDELEYQIQRLQEWGTP